MSDAFHDRQAGEEAKFRLDQELQFKADSRRNKLLGQWLAEGFGLTGADANAYARDVVIADLEAPGIEDVLAKVMTDIGARGSALSETDIRCKIEELQTIAEEQVRTE